MRPLFSTEPKPAAAAATQGTQRGRPRKPAAVRLPSIGSFEEVKAKIVAIAADRKLLAGAKARVRFAAIRSRALRPVTNSVLDYLLDRINPNEGRDWHGERTIAKDLGVTTRSVQRAFRELGSDDEGAGIILRRPRETVTGTKASSPWETTIPALVLEAEKMHRERQCKGDAKHPTKKSPSTRPNMQEAPDHLVGLTGQSGTRTQNSHTAHSASQKPMRTDGANGIPLCKQTSAEPYLGSQTGPEGELRFSPSTLATLKRMGCDVSSLMVRFLERTKNLPLPVRNPDAYVIKMGEEEIAKCHGLTPEQVKAAASCNPRVRTAAFADATGAFSQPSPNLLERARRTRSADQVEAAVQALSGQSFPNQKVADRAFDGQLNNIVLRQRQMPNVHLASAAA